MDNPAFGFIVSGNFTAGRRVAVINDRNYAGMYYTVDYDTDLRAYYSDFSTGKFLVGVEAEGYSGGLDKVAMRSLEGWDAMWVHEYQGNSTYYIGIQEEGTVKYLNAVPTVVNGTTTYELLLTETKGTLWQIHLANGGGVVMRFEENTQDNVVNYNKALGRSGNNVVVTDYVTSTHQNYSNIVWRRTVTSNYRPMIGLEVELVSPWVDINGTTGINITPVPADASWQNDSDYRISVSDETIAEKMETGGIKGLANGSTVITVTHKQTGISQAVAITVGQIIVNGSYYIKNAGTGRYAEVENGSSTECAPIQVNAHHTNTWMRWNFLYLENGIYAVQSDYLDIYCLGVEDTTTPSGAAICQRLPEESEIVTWKILGTTSGNYIFCSQAFEGEEDMVIFEPPLPNANGTDLQLGLYTDNTTYLDEWIIGLPTSGYELDYEPELWNYFPVQFGTNCYAYALNNQVYPHNTYYAWWMEPGRYGYLITGEDYFPLRDDENPDILKSIREDAAALGFTFRSIGKYDVCSEGAYKVALVVESLPSNSVTNRYGDYHWYRQDSDGYWSHKPGNTEVNRLDGDDNLILDPENANRGTYVVFIGFFEVTPLNGMAGYSMDEVEYIH